MEKGIGCQKIEAASGVFIVDFAQELTLQAQQITEGVIARFNGIDIFVRQGASVKDILANFDKNAFKLKLSLTTLNFDQCESVLEWICDFQEVAYCLGFSVSDRNYIVSIFKMNGYDINTRRELNENNPVDYAKYIVGQVLDDTNAKVSPQIVYNFVNNWKQKFGREQAEQEIQAIRLRISEIKDEKII